MIKVTPGAAKDKELYAGTPTWNRLAIGDQVHSGYLKIAYILFIYQLFWTQAYPEGMYTNGTQVPCEEPSLPNPTTRKGWPHHRGLRPLLFSNSDGGSFTSHKNKSV